jgi:Integrase core domain
MSFSEKNPDLTREVLSLWKDVRFCGAYSGLLNLQQCLKHDKNISLTIAQLRDILRNEPLYLQHIQARYKFPRRSYGTVHGFGQLWESDIAYVFKSDVEENNYFLTAVDVFSRRIFARALKTKSAKDVQLAFDAIFKEANIFPSVLQTDRGSEFRGSVGYFRKHNIFWKIKRGSNKGSNV